MIACDNNTEKKDLAKSGFWEYVKSKKSVAFKSYKFSAFDRELLPWYWKPYLKFMAMLYINNMVFSHEGELCLLLLPWTEKSG